MAQESFLFRCKVCDRQWWTHRVQPTCRCGEKNKLEVLQSQGSKQAPAAEDL